MGRKVSELLQECKDNNIKLVADAKHKLTTDDYEVALRDFYWSRDHVGEKMMPQIEPQSAQNIKYYDEADKAWADCPDHKTGYCQQRKLDGERSLMFIGTTSNRFTSRNRSDNTFLFGEKTDNFLYHRDMLFKALAGTVLDGEAKSRVAVIITDKTRTVSELQATVAIANSDPEKSKRYQDQFGIIKYHIFDILRWKGEDITHKPYWERLEILAKAYKIIQAVDHDDIFVMEPTFYTDKYSRYEQWVKKGEEGCMLKDLSSPYETGKRTWTWLKSKRFEEVDGIVTGFERGVLDGINKNMIGSLVLSCYDEKGELREVATVGAFPAAMRESITVYNADKDEVKLKPSVYGKILVVRGQEWTKNIKLKHANPVLQDPTRELEKAYFRTDKNAKDCTVEFKKIEAKIKFGGRI